MGNGMYYLLTHDAMSLVEISALWDTLINKPF